MAIWRLSAAAAAAVLGIGAAQAGERERLGWSLAISNDSIGELLDRWQSSSVQYGAFYGSSWEGAAPTRFGEVLEFRICTDILTPSDLEAPDPSDRRHAGVLAFGVHFHSAPSDFEVRGGIGLVVVGPQTGLLDLQQELHKALGFTVPTLEDFQIEDTARLNLSGEIGRVWDVGAARVRPFVEAQIGMEDFLRAGLGGGDADFNVVIGADVARVVDSIYLPKALGYELTPLRARVCITGPIRGMCFTVLPNLVKSLKRRARGRLWGRFRWPGRSDVTPFFYEH